MRRTTWCACVGLVLALAACGNDAPTDAPAADASTAPVVEPAPGEYELSMEHGGVTRSYRVHAPAGYDPATPVPLVMALHPYPGDGQEMSALSGLDDVAAREGFLVAYPDGIDGGFNAFVCCGDADDVGYLEALTEHLVQEWSVDPDRVYLTGVSNGGDLSFRAAVEAPGVFAAIGAVSGGFIGARAAEADYAPTSPVSVITFIGSQDRYAAQFEAGVQAWRERLGCAEVGPSPERPAGDVTLNQSRCADGSDVSVYVVDGMGHAWPGLQTGPLAAPNTGVQATELLWGFFAAHPRLG